MKTLKDYIILEGVFGYETYDSDCFDGISESEEKN